MSISRLQFAKWSFERDKSVGLYKRTIRWETLHPDDRKGYLEEADHYFTLPQDEWPDDILERLVERSDEHPL